MEEPPDSSSKKRKLTFSTGKCCFCLKAFDGNRTGLDPNKFDSLLEVCKGRNDELALNIVAYENQIRANEVKVFYHKTCRAKYVHPFYHKKQDTCCSFPTEKSATITRSQSRNEIFDWKENCFICGNKCSEKHRSEWSRVEGSINENSKLYSTLIEISRSKCDHDLHARLLSTNGDLVAAEARYHRKKGCLPRYISDQNKINVENDVERGKLIKASRLLQNELKKSIDEDKHVYELSELKSRVAEICNSNGIDIGSKIKAKHFKKALLQVWPNIMFIPRQGLTDLVCSNSITVDDALSKSVELERSLHDEFETEECASSLQDSFMESDEISIIHQAATILRNRILKTDGLSKEYFSSDEISFESQVNFIDPLLLRFMNWLSSDSKLNEGVNINDCNIDKKTVSICSDITALVSSVVTPKHLGLTVYLHHLYGSKKLIEDLNAHGYTLTYQEVRHFLTSAAVHMSNIQQQTPSGGIVPDHSTEDPEPGRLLIAAADNWDHNENTLSGKNSTHAMTSILISQKTNQSRTPSRITRIQERSVATALLPERQLSQILHYKKPSQRPTPQLHPPVSIEELNSPEPDNARHMRLKEIMYNIGRDKLLCMCDDRSECLPPWTVFQTNVQTDRLFGSADIVFNPIIMAPPNDYSTVYTTLKRVKEQMSALGQTVCPIYFDMGLLSKALEIVWAKPDELEGVLPLEGGMHFMMCLFGGIGHLYGGAGLRDLLVESDVFAKLTADHILSGKDFDRALRALIMVDEVLNRRFYLQFYEWAEKNSKDIPPRLFQKLKNIDKSDESDLNAISIIIESEVLPLIEQFRSEGRALSPLFTFWDDYINKVSLPLKLFLASSRHAMWDVHQYSKMKLLPFLFASNRTVYSKFMSYMVLKMNRLPDQVSDSFTKGLFVTKLSQAPFSAVWYDYVLEVTENKALKSSGGIIGLTHNDGALERWFLARPVTAKYAMAYTSSNVKSQTKHHTETPYHTKSYDEAVGKMLDMFDGSFIDPFSLTNPPTRLVNFATGVEAPQDVENSLLSCHDTGEKMLHAFVKDRLIHENNQEPSKKFFDPLQRQKVKTMGGSTSVLKTKSKTIKIDGEEMYLRLLAINAFKKVPLDRVLSFENAPFPLSLFTDDGDMMSTKKSDFLEKIENLIGPESVKRSIQVPDCILFDAMAVVQMLQPLVGTKQTYKQMAADFWNYILNQSKGIPDVHVVFDRYMPNSLKSQTRKKRGEHVSSNAPAVIQYDMVIPDWKRVLTSSKSKGELTKLYTKYLTENCHNLLGKGKTIFVSGGMEQTALEVSCDMVSFIHEIKCNHEEADTRLLLHLLLAASSGVKSVVVVSPDTDVLILLVHHYSKVCVGELYFKTGRKCAHSDMSRYIPVHSVVAYLSPAAKNIILAVYCLTGCDTCSSFFGIVKKKTFQIMLKHAEQLSGMSNLGKEPVLSAQTKAAAVAFVGLLYGSNQCISLNSLRTSLVLAKNHIKPRKLPPTEDSFLLHLLRCMYQMIIWRGALEAYIELPDPRDFGYTIDHDTGLYSPQLMNQSAAPPELLNDFVCVCTDKCSEECVCSSNEQPCTQACECLGCVEDGNEICQNLFTMLASIDSHSNLEC